ncbi:MAG: PH domain-containing protein [Halobacteriota archaeon]
MRLHPLTILLEGVGRAFGAGVAGFTIGSVLGTVLVARGLLPAAGSAAGVPLAILFGAIAVGYEFAHYRHFEYELTANSLDITSGVFFRRDREIPLGRVQNVDISRDVLARLLGVAVVSVETAGGGETEARLRYVGFEESRRLQEQIRQRKRTARADTEPEDDAEPDERELLFALSDRDLLLLSVLSFDPRILSVVFVVAPAFGPNIVPDIETAGGLAVAVVVILGAVATVVGLWALSAAATFVQFYGFKLHRLGDELQYERGLIQRYDGSIPTDKIQTLVVEENVLMRQFGFAGLSVDTAGYAPGSTPTGGSEAAIPLAAKSAVYDLARDIEPFDRPSIERPPKRARRRYFARYSLVVAGLTGIAFAIATYLVAFPWYWLLALLVAVPFAADRKWRHRGWALGPGYAFTRTGFFRRKTHVVPDFRVQTVIERQSLFQRRWSIASVIVDTASSSGLMGSDAVAIDLDVEDAHTLRESIRDRLQQALGARRTGPDGD